ncbi:transcription factor grauzone-like [Lucilia sericata]|uniref:transcription factor grauzone-like n=1 Tax=Lucilia sericata TaxID=13632 RepID=UPI0018A87F2A|nr:transcription factor grauzone-like [Lucilia sericata]
MKLSACSWMCSSCWKQLESFNLFYTRIEEAHANFGSIKIEGNQWEPKVEVSNNESGDFHQNVKETKIKREPEKDAFNGDDSDGINDNDDEDTDSEPDKNSEIENNDCEPHKNSSEIKEFFQRYRLVDHLQVHFNPDHFKCKHCGKVLSNSDNFQKHMLRLHRPKGVNLTHCCEILWKVIMKASLLRYHKLQHLPEEEKKFPCKQCGKFSYKCRIQIHMDKHEGIPPPSISCDICGLLLTSERGLKRHKDNQHPVGGKQDHPCPVCHKISPTRKALLKHVSTMHKKGYDHKCNICEKAFKRAEALREHMASHTGTPLYTCTWCPKTFYSNGNMHAHRKRVHRKEWEEAKLQKYSGKLPILN